MRLTPVLFFLVASPFPTHPSMNILVTGGAGFIGSNLVHYLLRDAAEELRVAQFAGEVNTREDALALARSL